MFIKFVLPIHRGWVLRSARLTCQYRSRNGDPVHQSEFNKDDKEWVISVRIEGSKDKKTCHIYSDGTGTTKKTDDRK